MQAVAEGLAARGHDVHVAARQGGAWPAGRVHWHAMAPPLGRPSFAGCAPARARAGREIAPTSIIERYYNFGGEGVLAAARLGVPAVLEVNAPVIDYPGSAKARLDRALLVEPMRRWRERLCRRTTCSSRRRRTFCRPGSIAAPVLEIEWGADVDRFRPDATGPVPFTRGPHRILCVFAGAFRSWHGAVHLAAALARLHPAGDGRSAAVFIGDGPERAAAERGAQRCPGVYFTGALPHDALPAALAAADIGVAPFEPARHAPLQLGFYWSPLKIFEYMAAACRSSRRRCRASRGSSSTGAKGLLYDPDDPRGLDQRARGAGRSGRPRAALGAAARARVVRDFSWDAHCAALDARLQSCPTMSAPLRVLHRDRLVSARLRRQRLEHVGAGARPPRARPPCRGRQGRCPGRRGVSERRTTASR